MGSLSAAVLAEGLSFRHRTTDRGVVGLDLVVEPGQVVAVIGANGAGKSTLARLVATALRGSGRLEILGVSAGAWSLGVLRRRMGVCLDRPAHVDELGGRENALFFARSSGMDVHTAVRAVDRLLGDFRLSPYSHEPVAGYSLGMRRKLGLVEAFAHEPELVVLDEPTLGLDVEARARLRHELRERTSAGGTVLLATNDLGLAETADRVLFLSRGRRVADDRPAALLADFAGVTLIHIDCELPGVPLPDPPPGVSLQAGAAGLRAESRRGLAPLPELLHGLLSADVRVRSVDIRSPGLADAFEALTGERISASGGAAEETAPRDSVRTADGVQP